MSELSYFSHRRIYGGSRRCVIPKRGLVVIQVYIDDSIKSLGRKTLFMAGYINSLERWDGFSSIWEATLKTKPSINYFKAAEASGMRGEFKGWGRLDRELKVQNLAEVIRRSEPISLHVSIDLKSFEESFQNDGVPWGFRDPYWLAFEAIVGKIPEIAKAQGLEGPVDFIFDRQTQIQRSVYSLWHAVKESQPEENRGFLAESPIFRDDKDILPLQAADMLAWHIQREFRSGALNPKMRVSEAIIRSGHHFTVDFDRHTLRKIGEGLQAVGEFAEIDSKREWRQVMDAIDDGNGAVGRRKEVPPENGG